MVPGGTIAPERPPGRAKGSAWRRRNCHSFRRAGGGPQPRFQRRPRHLPLRASRKRHRLPMVRRSHRWVPQGMIFMAEVRRGGRCGVGQEVTTRVFHDHCGRSFISLAKPNLGALFGGQGAAVPGRVPPATGRAPLASPSSKAGGSGPAPSAPSRRLVPPPRQLLLSEQSVPAPGVALVARWLRHAAVQTSCPDSVWPL